MSGPVHSKVKNSSGKFKLDLTEEDKAIIEAVRRSGLRPVREEDETNIVNKLKELGLDLTPPLTIGIFGPPLAGKSILSWLIAKEIGQAIIYATEEQYENPEYMAMFNKVISGSEVRLERIYSLRQLASKLRRPQRVKLIVIDSLSALADIEAHSLLEKGIDDVSILAARLNPITRIITSLLNRACNIVKAIGLAITHASSMAGRGQYMNIVPYRPSFSGRCLHYLTHLIYMDREDDEAKLTLVASRTRPWLKGKSIKLKLEVRT